MGCLSQLPDAAVDYPVTSIMSPSSDDPLRIHSLLAYSPDRTLPFRYNLVSSPSSLAADATYPHLHEPATRPSRQALCVVVPWATTGEWHVLVKVDTGHVTCLDVLHALHRDLRRRVTHAEYRAIGADMDARRRVDAAYFARCGRILDSAARAAEEKQGVKRVDFLAERATFGGLSARADGSWCLHTWL